jgi:Aspartyl protease
MESNDNVITVTIVDVTNASGQSATESLSISSDTTISDLMEFIVALLPSLLLPLQVLVASNNTSANNDSNSQTSGITIQLIKDGKVLYTSGADTKETATTLQAIGIVDNDIIACRRVIGDIATNNTGNSTDSGTALQSQQQQHQSSTPSAGLDFSNLLQDYNMGNQTSLQQQQQASSLLSTTTAARGPPPVDYVYHGPTMNLQEAQYYNPHPTSMVTLLYDKPHLLKELNYYAPTLAKQLISLQQSSGSMGSFTSTTGSTGTGNNENIKNASEIYRNYMIQQSITSAFNKTSRYHLENEMRMRYVQNPNDIEASEYVQKQERQTLIQEQYEYVMNEYPESVVGRVLMLYIPMKINGFPVSAFIDSGAQQTIMSLSLAKQCQIDQYIDTRMAGIAVGVGTGVILGRIHIVQIEITCTITKQIYYFPCSITVMDDPKPKSNHASKMLASGTARDNMQVDGDKTDVEDDVHDETVGGKEIPFLFGLDMLKRHLCCLDLSKGCLRFTQILIGNDDDSTPVDINNDNHRTPQYLEVPFLHEKDLLPSQGGTMKTNTTDTSNMATDA